MHITLASRPATVGATNLDWAGAAACGTAVVLDGLTESGDTGCAHGTAWYVSALGTRLLAAAANLERPLAEALEVALAEVAAVHRGSCDLTHPGTPGATVAAVRLRQAGPAGERAVEYLVLADAVVVLDNGPEPTVLSDRRVDAHLPDLSAAAAGPDLPSDAGRDGALRRLIEAQQGLRNTPAGYWVARADPDAAGHAVVGVLPGVRAALLLTDGAALLATHFGALAWRELLDLALGSGPAAVIAATRELETRDPGRAVWPRYKTHDDATAVLCDLR